MTHGVGGEPDARDAEPPSENPNIPPDVHDGDQSFVFRSKDKMSFRSRVPKQHLPQLVGERYQPMLPALSGTRRVMLSKSTSPGVSPSTSEILNPVSSIVNVTRMSTDEIEAGTLGPEGQNPSYHPIPQDLNHLLFLFQLWDSAELPSMLLMEPSEVSVYAPETAVNSDMRDTPSFQLGDSRHDGLFRFQGVIECSKSSVIPLHGPRRNTLEVYSFLNEVLDGHDLSSF